MRVSIYLARNAMWCPFSRYPVPEKGTYTSTSVANRIFDGINESCMCYATDCMAWRGTSEEGYCGAFGSKDLVDYTDVSYHKEAQDEEDRRKIRGYKL